MKPLEYVFTKEEEGSPCVVTLTQSNIRFTSPDTRRNYWLSEVAEVSLSYHPEAKEVSPYSCTLYFNDGEQQVIYDSDDGKYARLMVALHRNLFPYLKNIRFTKSLHVKRFHLGAVGVLKAAGILLLLLMFAPLILLLALISLPFWGAPVLGFFVNLVTSISYHLRHSEKAYQPQELPESVFPVSVRPVIHQFSAQHDG